MILSILLSFTASLGIDNTPQDWSRLAMMLTPGSCASFIMPHEVCADRFDDIKADAEKTSREEEAKAEDYDRREKENTDNGGDDEE